MQIQKKRPALVITDILMPKMDGFSLVYHLRTDPATREIPVSFSLPRMLRRKIKCLP